MVLLREHEVELAALERRDAVLGLELARVDLQLRVLAGEAGDHGREQRAVRAGERRRAQDAGHRGALARERRLGGLELAQHGLGAEHELLPGGGEAAGAAVALEEDHAGLALQRRELLRDGRRRVPERVGGGGDRAAGGELAEDTEAADVEHTEAQLTNFARNRNWKSRCVAVMLGRMRPVHLALALLVAAIWGLNFVVIEVGLEDFPPLLLSALRYALAALPLVFLGGMPSVAWRWVIAAGVAIGVVKFSLLFIGMDVGMPAGVASLVLQAQALFTVVLAAAVLRERITAPQVAGLAVAFAGLALVAGGLEGESTAAGFALVIAAAAAWGVGNLVLKRAAPADPLRFMTWMCVVPPIPLLALSLAFEGPEQISDASVGRRSRRRRGGALPRVRRHDSRLGPVGPPARPLSRVDGRPVLVARARVRALVRGPAARRAADRARARGGGARPRWRPPDPPNPDRIAIFSL